MAKRSFRTNWSYLLIGLAVASLLLFAAPADERPHWTSYLELSWGIWLLAMCSLLFLAPAPMGAILVTVVAVLVILIYGVSLLIVISNAPYYGGVQWLTVVLAAAVIVCAIVSIGIARRRAP